MDITPIRLTIAKKRKRVGERKEGRKEMGEKEGESEKGKRKEGKYKYGQGCGEMEHLCIADKNVNGAVTMENSKAVPQKKLKILGDFAGGLVAKTHTPNAERPVV